MVKTYLERQVLEKGSEGRHRCSCTVPLFDQEYLRKSEDSS